MLKKGISFACFFILLIQLMAQDRYLGADLSYLNEMEDCGAVFSDDNISQDPFQLFADRGNELVRLRLWHTPAWYDTLNTGKRYSDLADVTQSIQRSKQAGMEVLLSVHLSDRWADPSNQIVPAAWLNVVDDTPVLGDSLYQYFTSILTHLNTQDLLPKIIQIGNETNKGILLSPADNEVWTLDWQRNAYLFNRAIDAIRDFESQSGKQVDIMLHIAGPNDAEWFLDQFELNGVIDYDWIGISYYWEWHQPATIQSTGTTISNLLEDHPGRKVMIVETGYPWTTGFNDNANNILWNSHPDYSPVSPQAQKDWLIDLTESVFENGGHGVLYWEPGWVSTTCSTPWGDGSHYENAVFFDFTGEVHENGGMDWYEYDFDPSTAVQNTIHDLSIRWLPSERKIRILADDISIEQIALLDWNGRFLKTMNQDRIIDQIGSAELQFSQTLDLEVPNLPEGIYLVQVKTRSGQTFTEKLFIGN